MRSLCSIPSSTIGAYKPVTSIYVYLFHIFWFLILVKDVTCNIKASLQAEEQKPSCVYRIRLHVIVSKSKIIYILLLAGFLFPQLMSGHPLYIPHNTGGSGDRYVLDYLYKSGSGTTVHQFLCSDNRFPL